MEVGCNRCLHSATIYSQQLYINLNDNAYVRKLKLAVINPRLLA